MASDPYAPDKVAHFPDRILALREGRQPVPAQVLLSIMGTCNHACSWCAFRDETLPMSKLFPDADGKRNPNRKIAFVKICEILSQCRDMGVRAIQLTGGGEPTLYPEFAAIASLVTEYGLELGLITNGCHVTEEMLPVLAKATWVRVSIDAGTPETYEKLHGISVDNWPKPWDAIRRLRELNGPEVGASFVVQKENWWESDDFARKAKEAGAHNVRLTALIHADGEAYFDSFNYRDYPFWGAERHANDKFRVHNLFSRRRESMHPPTSPTCHYQHLAPFIGDDLNVYRCCNTAFTPAGLVGSIVEQSFRQLWESEATYNRLFSLDARTCPFCIFQDKNAVLAQLVAPPVGHDCFV